MTAGHETAKLGKDVTDLKAALDCLTAIMCGGQVGGLDPLSLRAGPLAVSGWARRAHQGGGNTPQFQSVPDVYPLAGVGGGGVMSGGLASQSTTTVSRDTRQDQVDTIDWATRHTNYPLASVGGGGVVGGGLARQSTTTVSRDAR